MQTVIAEAPSRATVAARASAVLELRQYTLRAGRRDSLIELFEREFIEPQEAEGMELVGQFRDLDAPDRFVWLRGFADHPTRDAALAAFYGGPTWRTHRSAANATMLDSDDVLLLRPARPAGGFALPARTETTGDDDTPDDGRPDRGVVVATVHHLRQRDPAEFIAAFERDWLPLLWDSNIGVQATLVTDPSRNGFPALPVREGESVFVWFRCHASLARAAQAQARLDEALEWAPRLAESLQPFEARPPQVLRLAPTPRSRLRGDA
jgi:hypothetical protein